MELFYAEKRVFDDEPLNRFALTITVSESNDEPTVHLTHDQARRLAEAILTKLYIPDKETP